MNKADDTTSLGNRQSKSQRLLIACGSDCNYPIQDSTEDIPIEDIPRFLSLLHASVLDSKGFTKALCFTPVHYATEPIIQSLSDLDFAHHTLPSPSIPIPRGADFIGRHVSQVEADVHLPLPDAYRTFQLQQSIRSMQRAGEPMMLMAHTPGVIGFHVRREAIKRRLRGKPIPFVAVHSSQYQRFTETRIVEIVDAIRQDHSVTINELFTHGGLLERTIPGLADAPEMRASIERLMIDLQAVIHHWYTVPNSSDFRANKLWGRSLLWLTNAASRYAHHRLQGSLAAAGFFQEIMEFLSHTIGMPIREVASRPIDASSLLDHMISDVAGQLVRGYLATFYAECERVINIEGDVGREDLISLGLQDRHIVEIDRSSDVCEQLVAIYDQILEDSSHNIIPKRQKLNDFAWGPDLVGFEGVGTHLAISDVHLGDGSGTERALATMALRPHCERLGVSAVEIVGDLIQRDVAPEASARHRESFLSALRHLTGSISSTDRSKIYLKVEADSKQFNSPKHLAEVQRELQSFALKVGAQVLFDETLFGVPDTIPSEPIPVYVERGNHDEGERLEDVVPGSHVSQSMIRLDKKSGVLFCHGNIWNLPEVPLAFKRSESLSELSESLTESNLAASLETAQVIYSMTSALWRACAKRIDVRRLWKSDLQPSLSRFVQWQRDRHADRRTQPTEFSQFFAGVISPVDNATVAAQCGILARGYGEFCWASCDGHSHRPSIEFVRTTHPQTGRSSASLLVNCGKFHGKNMTAVMLRFPEAVILEWDDRDQSFYVLQRYRLSEEEIQIVLSSSGPIQAPAVPLPTHNSPKPARTLLEICSEGAGHKERQLSLLPLYEDHGTVHVAASGERSITWAHEHWPGHRIIYDRSGNVRRASTLVSYVRNQSAILRQAKNLLLHLDQYTHTITDFAPVLPAAVQLARKRGQHRIPPLFHISHHAAMHSRFKDTPKPLTTDSLTYWATQRYLDSISGDFNIGFHFEAYHPDIFTPPISQEILNAVPTFNSNIVLVYLTGSPQYLAEQCARIDHCGEHEWHIYSAMQSEVKQSAYKHVWLFPLDQSFRNKLPHVRSVVTSCGFMGPSELLHLGKPFAAIPTQGHGEHSFNAAALQEISDVTVVPTIAEESSHKIIRRMLHDAKSIDKPLQRTGRMGKIGPYRDVRADVVKRIYDV
jgi:uncharacterized protein (TIGR00661 family)